MPLLWAVGWGGATVARAMTGDVEIGLLAHLSPAGVDCVDSALVANRDRPVAMGDFGAVGVACRRGEGEAGDSGRRNGELR